VSEQHVNVSAALNPATTKQEYTTVPVGNTVLEILNKVDATLAASNAAHVRLNGNPVPRKIWSELIPGAGSKLLVRVVPTGDGDPEGTKVLRSVLMIGITALSLGVGGAWGAGIAIGGFFAVNALVPLPQLQADAPSGAADSDGLQRTPMLSGARNSMSPYGPVPVILGKHRITPPLGAQPYTELDQSDQFLRMIMIPGYGPLVLTDPKIGETPLENFSEVQTEIQDGSNDDADLALFPSTVTEDTFSILLKQTDDWVTRRTQEDVDEIGVELTFPRGLVKLETDGRKTERQVDIEAEYREVGGGSWSVMGEVLDVPARTFRPSEFPGGLDEYFQIVIDKRSGRVSAREIRSVFGLAWYALDVPEDKFLIAVVKKKLFSVTVTDHRDSALTQYDSGHFAPTKVGDNIQVAAGQLDVVGLSTSGRTTSAIRKGLVIKVDRDQYDVRVRRTTVDTTNDQILDEVYWTALRSITNEDPVALDNVAEIALRIKATDQLQGVVDQFNILAHSIVKDWDSATSTWIERPSSNPASLYRHLLQGPMNKRPVADARIDLMALQTWHEWCEANGHEFNGVVNRSTTLLQILQDVAAVGRASPTMKDGLFSVVQDVAQSTPCQLFTPKNSRDFSASRNFADLPHALKVQFVNGLPTHELTATPANVEVGDVFDLVFGTVTLASYTAAAATVADVTAGLKAAWDASSEDIAGFYDATDDTTHLTLKANRPSAQYGITSSTTDGGGNDTQTLTVANISSEGTWERDEVIVYDDGYDATTATKFEEVSLFGVVNDEQAWKMGRYHLAVARLRSEVYVLHTDVEHIVCNRGDLVRVQHDVPSFGLSSGRVTNRATSGGNVTTITLDETVTMETSKSYAVRYRQEDMTVRVENVNTDVGDQTTLTFSTPVAITNAPAVGDLVAFGEQSTETVEMIVHQIEMGPKLTATLTLVDAAPGVHTADSGTIPAFTPGVSTAPELQELVPAVPEIVSLRSGTEAISLRADGTGSNHILATIRAGAGGDVPTTFFDVQFRLADGIFWRSLPRLTADALEFTIDAVQDGETYDVRIRAVSQWGVVSEWTTQEDYTVLGVIDTTLSFVDIADVSLTLSDGNVGNAKVSNEILRAPINAEETWAEHFTERSWANIQAQIDAGYPYYSQPTKPTGGWSNELPDPAEGFLEGAWLNSGVVGTADDWSRADDDMDIIGTIAGSDYQPTATGPSTSGHSWAASTEGGAGQKAWNAADHNGATAWLATAAPPGWWEYTPDVPVKLGRIKIEALSSGANRGPRDFTVEGWDGWSWTVLKTVTGEVGWGIGEVRTFDWSNDVAYSKYRVNITLMDTGITNPAMRGVEWFVVTNPTWGSYAGADFDGTDNHLYRLEASWHSTDGTGTISAWIRTDAIGSAQTIFASADEATDTRYLKLSINASGYLEVSQRDNDTADVVRGSTVLTANTWYHVACVCGLGGYLLYVNGMLETNTISGGTNGGDWLDDTSARDNVTIGALVKTSVTEPFDGEIKDVRYYSVRILTAAELLTLYTGGRGAWELTYDYGSTLYNTRIKSTITLDKIDGNVTVTPSISVSNDLSTWIDYVGSDEINVTAYRYVRVRYDFAATDDTGLVLVTNVQLKIDARERFESALEALASGDADGTEITFDFSFAKVLSISVTPQGTTAEYCVVNFDFAQDNPTSFKVKMFDEDGVRVSGNATYTARGY
jgi:hypothetical protein